MRRSSKLLMMIGGLVLIVVLWGWYFYPCVKFVPLILERGFHNTLIPAPDLMNAEYIENLLIILTYHGERFRVNNNGTVFITWHLALDEELIWNYSTKASDKNFVTAKKREMYIHRLRK